MAGGVLQAEWGVREEVQRENPLKRHIQQDGGGEEEGGEEGGHKEGEQKREAAAPSQLGFPSFQGVKYFWSFSGHYLAIFSHF